MHVIAAKAVCFKEALSRSSRRTSRTSSTMRRRCAKD